MRRREFITLLGGAVAFGLPLAARAQQPAMPVIGFLRSTSPADSAHLVVAFRQGLKEAGFVEGQNVAIEYRWANNQLDNLPALAADLVRRQLAVIVANVTSLPAVKATATTIPIVFMTGSDPVRDGLVANLNRPGGNLTGAVFFSDELGTKRLELLRQIMPRAAAIGVLMNSNNPGPVEERRNLEAAASKINQDLFVLDVDSDDDLEPAFAAFAQHRIGALLIGSGAFMFAHRERLVTLAARQALPAIYPQREYVTASGLMSYGTSTSDAYRQVGIYAGRILKGEKPGDLPIMRPTKFEFVINLRTAKALGLDIPPTLLALADEVIE
jgi:putative ABC transport system substrate-binding protein